MIRLKSRLLVFMAPTMLALLGACAVYVTPLKVAARPVITQFTPDRGAGSVYRPGQSISFTLKSEREGFVSLFVTDPDGSRYLLARNLPVYPGTNRLGGPSPTTRFAVVPPVGQHRVRAYFSERPILEVGRLSTNAESSLSAHALEVVETSFVLRSR